MAQGLQVGAGSRIYDRQSDRRDRPGSQQHPRPALDRCRRDHCRLGGHAQCNFSFPEKSGSHEQLIAGSHFSNASSISSLPGQYCRAFFPEPSGIQRPSRVSRSAMRSTSR